MQQQFERKRGAAMLIVIALALGLMTFSLMTLQMSQAHSVTQTSQSNDLEARQVAESGVAQAIARIKDGGFVTPMSGGGVNPAWINFSQGQLLYYTTFDAPTDTAVIRSWGRVAAANTTSSSSVPPDDSSWDGTGWQVEGIEVTLRGSKYIPKAPLYMGNGGIERPLGGFSWTGGSDATDPSTWGTITSNPSSYQSAAVPFEASALDHPADYLYNGGTPTPASAYPHPYNIWAAQNPIGQFNVEAWFANSAGSGNDPTIGLTPPPTSSYYDMSNSSSPDYAYPVDPNLADVQTFGWEVWNTFKNDPATTLLNQGVHSGTYGDMSNPGVTVVTGELQVNSGSSFKGAGILLIRDDYDPNVDTNNKPSQRARLDIDGKFEWTGLVIVAGWAPDIDVSSTAGAEATIVGALFGEDSVQSGGEISLDSATIIMRIRNDFRVLYSYSLFQPGGMVHQYLPAVHKDVVGSKDIY